MHRTLLLVLVLAHVVAGCGEEWSFGSWTGPLSAVCTINVQGKGNKQVETDYVPHVICCENGNADFEALKAQAVAARGYMYYASKKSGSICDSQSCQVYGCSRCQKSGYPTAQHHAAAKATAGQVLMWGGVTIAPFYVAGAKPSTSSCKALSSDSDPTKTEKWVTYNQGKSGSGVTQTKLGWVNPGNKYNRGCKSQNGAHCLSQKGKKYPEILRFYYGADIQLVTATGPCVGTKPDSGPPPDTKPPPGDTRPPPGDTRPPPRDTRPPTKKDNKPPPRDTKPPTKKDSKPPPTDTRPPSYADGLPPPINPGQTQLVLHGGCSSAPGVSSGWWLVLLLLCWGRRFTSGQRSNGRSPDRRQ